MNKYIITAMIVFVLTIVGSIAMSQTTNSTDSATSSTAQSIVVHKSSTCGCCGVYVSYMKIKGYDVEVKDTENLEEVKQNLGVPSELESCHTTEVGEYVVEGHIPEEAIQKLITEKPDIKGIGMAGMPSGSPGMPGPKYGEFVIYEITNDGTKGDIFMKI
ncbi:MAG: hypothetical protein COV70_01195 [Parcubacteria group bacterium CG11_big_fil_rev_8_21_14_0_20_39_22]|nr:MAG: hypothetical protein COV70_01195 [Parcubacteria group bacterium CG11_big_fil_rev_8_21_14_0_20_39_22]